MKARTLVLSAALLSSGFLGAAAVKGAGGFAAAHGRLWHGPGGSGLSPVAHLDALVEHLELDAAQRRALADAVEPVIDPALADVRRLLEAHQRLAARIHSDPLDEAAIRGEARELGGALEELALRCAELRADVAVVLDSKQKGRLDGGEHAAPFGALDEHLDALRADLLDFVARNRQD